METGNESGNIKKHQSLVQCLLYRHMSDVFCHYSCILLSNGYKTRFMSHVFAFTPVMGFVIICTQCDQLALMW